MHPLQEEETPWKPLYLKHLWSWCQSVREWNFTSPIAALCPKTRKGRRECTPSSASEGRIWSTGNTVGLCLNTEKHQVCVCKGKPTNHTSLISFLFFPFILYVFCRSGVRGPGVLVPSRLCTGTENWAELKTDGNCGEIQRITTGRTYSQSDKGSSTKKNKKTLQILVCFHDKQMINLHACLLTCQPFILLRHSV